MRKMSVTQIPLLCMPVNNSQIEVGPASLTRKIESELRINISIRSIYEPSASPFAVRRRTRRPPHLQSSEEKHSKHPRALQASTVDARLCNLRTPFGTERYTDNSILFSSASFNLRKIILF